MNRAVVLPGLRSSYGLEEASDEAIGNKKRIFSGVKIMAVNSRPVIALNGSVLFTA